MVDNVGCWLLVAGCWLLVLVLAAGCWKRAGKKTGETASAIPWPGRWPDALDFWMPGASGVLPQVPRM